MNSYNSQRRLTPVPSDHIQDFGRDYSLNMLPAISESPPEDMSTLEENIHHTETASSDQPEERHEHQEKESQKNEESCPNAQDDANRIQPPHLTSGVPPLITSEKSEDVVIKMNGKDDSQEIDPLIASYSGPSSKIYAQCSITSFGESKHKIMLPTPTQEDTVQASIQLFISVYNILWTLSAFFWHFSEKKLEEAKCTLAVLVLSALIVEIFYFFNSNISKSKIWRHSKLLWLVFLIPGFLPITMALTNLVFTAKEKKDKQYTRPFANTELVFLVESLSLALPQCILQLTILMEDNENFPSVKWGVLGKGLLICIVGIAFARIRFDAAKKSERFGVGVERYIRFLVIGASKVLWIVTMASLIVSIRIAYGRGNISAVVIAVAGLTAFYEIPMMLSALEGCGGCMSALTSLFFLLPQFAALVCHILWINLDKTIFSYNIGGFILGVFFGVESLCLAGWLLDRCTNHDLDFMACYPHFFGNVFKKCCKCKEPKGSD